MHRRPLAHKSQRTSNVLKPVVQTKHHMAAAGIDDRCSRILLAAAVVVTILGLLAAPASAREVPDELMKQQRVSTQHDVPSGPNPGSNLSPRLPPPHDIVRP